LKHKKESKRFTLHRPVLRQSTVSRKRDIVSKDRPREDWVIVKNVRFAFNAQKKKGKRVIERRKGEKKGPRSHEGTFEPM